MLINTTEELMESEVDAIADNGGLKEAMKRVVDGVMHVKRPAEEKIREAPDVGTSLR